MTNYHLSATGLAAVAFLTASLHAQPAPPPPAPLPAISTATAETRTLAAQMFELLDFESQFRKQLEPMMEYMANISRQSVEASGATLNEGQIKALNDGTTDLLDYIIVAIDMESLKVRMVDAYAETFSAEELAAIVAFFKTDAGQAFIQRSADVQKPILEFMETEMARLLPEIQRLSAEMATAIEAAADTDAHDHHNHHDHAH